MRVGEKKLDLPRKVELFFHLAQVPRRGQLSCGVAAAFDRFGIDAAAVQCVVNDLAHGGDVRVYVHAFAGAQVAQDALGGDVQRGAGQFRVAARLNVVNCFESLFKR